ncbi:LysR family transcriptional regulator [Vibrio maritimus]|uniref:LysR family transcriptional regulator n=1 Tax=Vibrio maritimus TaxID=990268 RepID=UPI001F18012C|nr:LysR family transcriptional regulator [Vibrio maritimus]
MPASLDQLRAFVATVENKGLAQAARSLGKHVSTVREQINNLEIDTGITLFDRYPRSLEVTSQGEQLYKSATAMLREASLFDANVESILQGVPEKLTFALDSGLKEPAVDAIIARFVEAFPHLSLQVRTGDTLQIKAWALEGVVDIGLIFNTLQLHTELSSEKAYAFGVNCVVPCSWNLPEQADTSSLLDKLQLSLSFLDEIGVRNADITSHRFMLCNDAVQILNLVKAGAGWGYLPNFVCQTAIQNEEVRLYQPTPDSISDWNTNLVWSKQNILNPAMRWLVNEIQKLPKYR